jgi:hypothetical protein
VTDAATEDVLPAPALAICEPEDRGRQAMAALSRGVPRGVVARCPTKHDERGSGARAVSTDFQTLLDKARREIRSAPNAGLQTRARPAEAPA